MSNEQRLEQLHQLIDELETEMWYNIHADSPHQAAKVKTWTDQLKEQASALHIQINNQTNNK
jgi:hypothetical protein